MTSRFRDAVHCITVVLALLLTAGLASATPDAIVVLGCQSRAELAARVDAAARTLAALPPASGALVVLSGGARFGSGTEASEMAARLARRVPDLSTRARVIQETDSLDTLGNAVFTALTLRRLGWPAGSRVVLVTSDFHLQRSLAYFARLLPQTDQLVGTGARPPGRSLAQDFRHASREAASLTRTQRGLFREVKPAAPDEVLAWLYLHHPYYRGRNDLLQRWR